MNHVTPVSIEYVFAPFSVPILINRRNLARSNANSRDRIRIASRLSAYQCQINVPDERLIINIASRVRSKLRVGWQFVDYKSESISRALETEEREVTAVFRKQRLQYRLLNVDCLTITSSVSLVRVSNIVPSCFVQFIYIWFNRFSAMHRVRISDWSFLIIFFSIET